MINITSSIQIKGGHVYEGTFNNTYFKLECSEVHGKIVCGNLITEYPNKNDILCMVRQCGYVDI